MRSVRGGGWRVEISTSFIHLAFYSKLQPDVTGVWASVCVRSCECVRKCGEGSDTEKVAVIQCFFLKIIFAPFFGDTRRTFNFVSLQMFQKCSASSLHSISERSCRGAAATTAAGAAPLDRVTLGTTVSAHARTFDKSRMRFKVRDSELTKQLTYMLFNNNNNNIKNSFVKKSKLHTLIF